MDSLRRTISLLLITLFLSVGFGVISYADAADFKVVVKPGTKAFTPQEIKIKLGDKVSWVNESGEEHYLTSAGPSSRQTVIGPENLEINQLLPTGASYTHSFKEPETYFYFCAIHTQMWGTVVVEK